MYKNSAFSDRQDEFQGNSEIQEIRFCAIREIRKFVPGKNFFYRMQLCNSTSEFRKSGRFRTFFPEMSQLQKSAKNAKNKKCKKTSKNLQILGVLSKTGLSKH
jgi:hypothetical protein